MRTLVAMITLALLGACGQTGPLYLPEEAPARTETGAVAGAQAEGAP